MAGETKGVRALGGVLDVDGVGVGTVTLEERRTGVTAVVFADGAVGAVDVSGGGPATRETDVLRPGNLVRGPDALLLTGGSAFGLRAADGAMEALLEAGRGVAAGGMRVPIVPTAALFDLREGQAQAPTPAEGRLAVERALRGGRAVEEGRAGAGTGATVGKLLGPSAASSGGQGAVTLLAPDGLRVGALVVVNALGTVIAADGRPLAGPRLGDGTVADSADLVARGLGTRPRPGGATTLGVVAVGARMDREDLVRVARMAHDGYARAIDPVHTPFDGDVVFAVATGGMAADPLRVGSMAARAVAEAVRRAVRPDVPERPLR